MSSIHYRRTLFDTPLLTPLFRGIAGLWLRLGGWQLSGELPDQHKFVIIAYPHTTNWDVPLTIAVCLRFRLKIYWMGKASLFRGQMGPLMKWFGGIPVYLDASRNQVRQMVGLFERSDDLVVVISPEGNRQRVERWKTGFYHMASGAGVAIVLGFLDFGSKRAGYLKTFHPSGNIDDDIEAMQAVYRGIKGRYPQHSRW